MLEIVLFVLIIINFCFALYILNGDDGGMALVEASRSLISFEQPIHAAIGLVFLLLGLFMVIASRKNKRQLSNFLFFWQTSGVVSIAPCLPP